MDKSKVYSAKEASMDWKKKQAEKNAYVDERKIEEIFDKIREKISSIEIPGDPGMGLRQYDLYGYLSVGEKKVLKSHGYKVEFKDSYDSMHGDYYAITW